MSTAQVAPLLLSGVERETLLTSIKHDLAIARMHQKNGKYDLVITPKLFVVRIANKAMTRADFDGFTCNNAKLLIKLYQQLCPADVEVSAIVEKALHTALSDQQGDFFMLRVRFTFKQRAKKARRFS